MSDTIWALFIQDDFRVRPELTINLGLRYERQTFTDTAKNFAPRVGFAYDWKGNGKTVLRGGFGLYYSQIVDNSEANYALSGPGGIFNYTAGPGQVGFPSTIAAAPLPVFPSEAVPPVRSLYIRPGQSAYLNRFFPTSTLVNYPDKLLNPYSEQWTFGVEQQLGNQWVLSLDYVGSHSAKINRPLDVDRRLRSSVRRRTRFDRHRLRTARGLTGSIGTLSTTRRATRLQQRTRSLSMA